MNPTTTMLALIFAVLLSFTEATYFSISAVRDGTPINFELLTANDERIWIGKTTTSYCPPQAEKNGTCFPGTEGTNFAFSGPTSLQMGAKVPGGQGVYIDSICGAICYTVPGTSTLPAGALVTGWSLDQEGSEGSLAWSNGTSGSGGFLACSSSGDSSVSPWQVFVDIEGVAFGDECISFDVFTTSESAPAAWEYV